MHRIDTQVIGQRVVIHVARFDDAAMQVHGAQAFVAVAAKAVVAEHVIAWIVGHGLRRAFAALQRRHGHEGLVGRTRRIGAAQRAIQQGFVERFVEQLPVFLIDAIDEQVGIERRFADEGQHLAGFGIKRDKGAAPLSVQLLDHFLQLDVQRQRHRITRRGVLTGQAAHGAPAGRLLDQFSAALAVQARLEALLDAQLTDVVGAAVIGRIVRLADARLLFQVDAPDVAHHMAGQFAKGVVAKQARLDLHAGKAVTLRGETRHFFIVQACANRQRLEAFELALQFLEAASIARCDLQQQ